MSEAAPIGLPINKQINEDLKKEYKIILEKHLKGRVLKEDKINSWMDNILIEAKEYFIKKYFAEYFSEVFSNFNEVYMFF